MVKNYAYNSMNFDSLSAEHHSVLIKYEHWKPRSHLKQGTIELSEAFDRFLDKLIIFEPIVWLGQIDGPIFIVTVCLPNCQLLKGADRIKTITVLIV